MRKTIALALIIFLVPIQTMALSNDIDGDGLLDSEEDRNGDGLVNTGETDFNNADTDGGGESDGSEVQAGRDPLDRTDDYTYDLDNDGLSNGVELTKGTDPSDPDTDGDGINDRDDPFPLESKYRQDSDNDGLPDEYELEQNLARDVRSDANEDPDNDGLSNLEEFIHGTDIYNSDTDQDGIEDGREIERESNPLENPCLYYAGPTEVLHDLEGHWSKDYVTLLSETKIAEDGPRIISGYETEEGSLFRPDQQISRFELLKIALLSSCIPLHEPETDFAFTDVRADARPHDTDGERQRRQVIYTAYERGIVEGYDDGSFKPDEPVNRAEALKMMLLTSKLEPFDSGSYTEIFTDVFAGDWFESYVNIALSYAFVEGYDDNMFHPERNMTRAEASKVLLLMMISNPRVNGYIIPVEGLDV